ncbi:hypothetical protein Tco_1566928, partial [Tanacetum coccineum]
MPRMAVPGTTKKSLACSEQTASYFGDAKNLKELYMLSFKATDFTQLHGIYRLCVIPPDGAWTEYVSEG